MYSFKLSSVFLRGGPYHFSKELETWTLFSRNMGQIWPLKSQKRSLNSFNSVARSSFCFKLVILWDVLLKTRTEPLGQNCHSRYVHQKFAFYSQVAINCVRHCLWRQGQVVYWRPPRLQYCFTSTKFASTNCLYYTCLK